MRDENKVLLERHFAELWGLGDLLVADEIYHPAYVSHTPCGSAGASGPEAEKRLVVLVRTALSGLEVSVDDLLAEDDRVAARWSMHGVDTGGFMGRPPTARPVRLSGVRIVRVASGKIVESWDVVDRLDLREQLGPMTSFELAEGDAR